MKKLLVSLVVIVMAVAAAAGTSSARGQAEGTIVDVAAGNPDFSTLVSLVKAAGLAGVLSDASSKLTVFAPTNAAFAKLESAVPGVTKALTDPANQELLQQVLKYHVLGSEVRSGAATEAATANSKVSTLLGGDTNGQLGLSLKGSQIAIADSAGIAGALVTAADVSASNGVIHVIDTVLVPKNVAVALTKAGLLQGSSIVDVAAGNKNLSTLVTLIKAAGLVDALADRNAQLTVFAPRNHAFAALEKAVPGVTKALLARKNKPLLVQVLKYHVLATKVGSTDAIAAAEKKARVTTLLGTNANGRIGLSLEGGKLRLSDSAGFNRPTVTRVDIAAGSGVIHVIDKVLVPKSVAQALTRAGLIR